jgi:Rrf2 family protein
MNKLKIVDKKVIHYDSGIGDPNMKVTALEEYGLRCLLQLARHAGSPAPITVRDIAAGEGLSTAYAEKLLRILGRGGLAISVRGSRGGYRLSRPPEQVTIGDAFRALGGVVSPADPCCHFTGKRDCCVHQDACGLRPVWSAVKMRLEHWFDQLPLSALLQHEQSVRDQLVSITSRTGQAGPLSDQNLADGDSP